MSDVHICIFHVFVASQVMLDGLAVHKYDHHWLHRNISIVGQEPTLYARSIRENIIYGLEGVCFIPLSFFFFLR